MSEGQAQNEPIGDDSPARLPEPPPYEPDDALITDLERGLRPDSPGIEQR